MAEKALASLSSGLLARKGQARPAMRSQLLGGFGKTPNPLEDLGWNDMGLAEPAPIPAPAPEPAMVAPIERLLVAEADASVAAEPDDIMPAVLLERETLRARIETPAAVKSVSVPTATRLQRETAHAGKAAFTLRVAADRHLRLRLASAITNRSAQDLVTEALDALIGAIPAVEALVAQLPTAKPAKNKR